MPNGLQHAASRRPLSTSLLLVSKPRESVSLNPRWNISRQICFTLPTTGAALSILFSRRIRFRPCLPNCAPAPWNALPPSCNPVDCSSSSPAPARTTNQRATYPGLSPATNFPNSLILASPKLPSVKSPTPPNPSLAVSSLPTPAAKRPQLPALISPHRCLFLCRRGT